MRRSRRAGGCAAIAPRGRLCGDRAARAAVRRSRRAGGYAAIAPRRAAPRGRPGRL
jgi:hypothetical protein